MKAAAMKRAWIPTSVMAILAMLPASLRADDMAKKIHDDFKPCLVAVKYSLKTEMRTIDWSTPGVVVSDDGLVMFSLAIVPPTEVPESQITHMKIIVPSDNADDEELDAVYQGRDERTNLAFVKAKDPRQWKSVKFTDVPLETGDTVYSIAMLPKTSGYRPNVTMAMVSTPLRGPVPQYLVDGGLAGSGGIVIDSKEEVVGYIHPRSLADALLEQPNGDDETPPAVISAPRYFVPSSDIMQSFTDTPTPDKPLVYPWIGCMKLMGLPQDTAEFYNLKNIPAVEVGDVIDGGPAAKAGLQNSDIIVKVNGEGLERGDIPDELPLILARKIERMKVGDTVTLSVIHTKDQPAKDYTVTLEERPKEATDVKRFYAEDIGMVVREAVFLDNYPRRLPRDHTGVVVAVMERQGSAAAAKLEPYDMITQMNGKPVTDLDSFKTAYEQIRADKPNDPLVLEISKQNNTEATINIEPPQQGGGNGAGGGGAGGM
ncbi:MAG: PDZ domain-containing protein [Tepidisphaeraceae bacterium]|jgi:serine protease Do